MCCLCIPSFDSIHSSDRRAPNAERQLLPPKGSDAGADAVGSQLHALVRPAFAAAQVTKSPY